LFSVHNKTKTYRYCNNHSHPVTRCRLAELKSNIFYSSSDMQSATLQHLVRNAMHMNHPWYFSNSVRRKSVRHSVMYIYKHFNRSSNVNKLCKFWLLPQRVCPSVRQSVTLWYLRITRKLCYRKDDRAMRHIYGCPENFPDSHMTTLMAILYQIFTAQKNKRGLAIACRPPSVRPFVRSSVCDVSDL